MKRIFDAIFAAASVFAWIFMHPVKLLNWLFGWDSRRILHISFAIALCFDLTNSALTDRHPLYAVLSAAAILYWWREVKRLCIAIERAASDGVVRMQEIDLLLLIIIYILWGISWAQGLGSMMINPTAGNVTYFAMYGFLMLGLTAAFSAKGPRKSAVRKAVDAAKDRARALIPTPAPIPVPVYG